MENDQRHVRLAHLDPLTDHLTVSNGNPVPMFMGAIAVAQSDRDVIYAGTGNNNSATPIMAPAFSLVDGGATWW